MSAGLQFRGTAKRVFALCALVAMSVVMARPLCDILELRGAPAPLGVDTVSDGAAGLASRHDESEPCCTSVDDESLAAPAAFVTPDIKSSPAIPALDSSSARYAAARVVEAPVPPDRPPISRPYHARSTRILR